MLNGSFFTTPRTPPPTARLAPIYEARPAARLASTPPPLPLPPDEAPAPGLVLPLPLAPSSFRAARLAHMATYVARRQRSFRRLAAHSAAAKAARTNRHHLSRYAGQKRAPSSVAVPRGESCVKARACADDKCSWAECSQGSYMCAIGAATTRAIERAGKK